MSARELRREVAAIARIEDPRRRREAAERALEVPTGLILEARERNPALGALDLEAGLERLEHEWVAHRGELIHLERHPAAPGGATFVIAPGLGDHARRLAPLAIALAERGHRSLVVDRRGHGLSEGRRGDATLEADLAVLELAIGLARAGAEGPVVLLGDSLGGIMSWYLLTREPDVEAAVCHCIAHPDVSRERGSPVRARIMQALAKALPYAPIAVTEIADYDQVALDPVTRSYFDQRLDRLFNFTVTARAAASYVDFRPAIPWEEVRTPVLVVIGAEDGMVTPAFTRRCFERATPPHADYVEVPGAGHQLFLDDLGPALASLDAWLPSALERSPLGAAG